MVHAPSNAARIPMERPSLLKAMPGPVWAPQKPFEILELVPELLQGAPATPQGPQTHETVVSKHFNDI